MAPTPPWPIVLAGDAAARGRAQAAARPELFASVREAIAVRLEAAKPVLARPRLAALLREMVSYAEEAAPLAVAEARGVAQGYGLAFDDLMAFLHLPVLLDAAKAEGPAGDGCSAWVARDGDGGRWLAKNRDYGGEHAVLQQLFRHQGPGLGMGPLLCLGSLGAPGAFSSGMNAEGLALVDTQVPTQDHGPGLCRYLLMTEILARAATVDEALALIRGLRHAGGGCLLLADRYGGAAAVELGHRHLDIESGDAPWLARTNHHLSPPLAPLTLRRPGEPMGRSSHGRLATLRAALPPAVPLRDAPAFARRVMAGHKADAPPCGEGLCRHGEDGASRTISSVLFESRARRLYLCDGAPCAGEWRVFALA